MKVTPLSIPPAVAQGDIRILAPAAALSDPARKLLKDGTVLLSEWGFSPTVDKTAYLRHHYFAGDDETRRSSLAAALRAPNNSAIWAARGGYGTAVALASLDVAAVRSRPKWLVGYSDVTAAHVLWQQAGLVSLHAVMVAALTGWTVAAREELLEILNRPERSVQHFAAEVLWRPRVLSSVSGIIWGGNLTVLASLVGTTSLPPVRGQPTVLFIEDTELTYRAHRSLNQLLCSGALKNVVGVLLGQWSAEQPSTLLEHQQQALTMLGELLASHQIPVLSGLPVGHAPSSRPLLLGARATLNLDSGAVVVDMTAERRG